MTSYLERASEAPLPDALAYFLTWTTYGTWLPGDERGWTKKSEGFKDPNKHVEKHSAGRLAESPSYLTREQRAIVENTIRAHCLIRGWELHAVNCRSNHIHVVVSADLDPKKIRNQFKAWCTRKLKAHAKSQARSASEMERLNWWTEGGSQRHLGNEESLESAILYTLDAQDNKLNED